MPCYTPLSAYKGQSVNVKTGKRPIVFQLRQGFHDLPIQLPCGRCTGCRLERSRQWAIRAMHESSLHEHSEFVTLTYSDEALAADNNAVLKELRYPDFQKFMKRLRFNYEEDLRRECEEAGLDSTATDAVLKENRLRFYMCGEYGEKFGRPHFHALIFGLHLKDKKHFKTWRGQTLYTSEFLTQNWGHGHASTGSVTFNSAAYVARYIMKKQMGRDADLHYERLDEYGEYQQITREFQKSSLKPGLGKGWFDKFMGDIYPKDYFHLNGTRMRPPKYYDHHYEIAYPEDMLTIKANRRIAMHQLTDEEKSRARLDDRWIIADIKADQLKRNLDHET